MLRSFASHCTSRDCMPVFTKPGQTQLTRMPFAATSRASAWVKPMTANLLAE